MADQKQRLFRLGRGYNGFFCPETRFHLMGGAKPQGVYPADIPLSDAVKRGLRGGTLVDVNRVVPLEEILTPKQLERYRAANPTVEVKAEEREKNVEPVKEEVKADVKEEVSEDESSESNANALTEDDIDSKTKAELLDFIKEEGLELEALGLNSRSNSQDVKDALKKHFGYAN